MEENSFDILQWMTNEARVAFLSACRRRRYSPGQVIYLQEDKGEYMFRLVRGSVRIALTGHGGGKLVFLLFQRGDCFGESSLVDGGPRPQTAETVNEVELDVLDIDTFRRLREQHRSFEDAIMRLLARQMRVVSKYYADVSLRTLPARVAERILSFGRARSAERQGGSHLSCAVSQAELAMMVGASRQSVNKALRTLERRGLVSTQYGEILVNDVEGLQLVAEQS